MKLQYLVVLMVLGGGAAMLLISIWALFERITLSLERIAASLEGIKEAADQGAGTTIVTCD